MSTWEAAELTSELWLLSSVALFLRILHLLHPREGGMLGGGGRRYPEKGTGKRVASCGHTSSGLQRLLCRQALLSGALYADVLCGKQTGISRGPVYTGSFWRLSVGMSVQEFIWGFRLRSTFWGAWYWGFGKAWSGLGSLGSLFGVQP